MRYYQIDILEPGSNDVRRSFTSFEGGKTNPNALNVELDVFVAPFATPTGASYARVWGVSLADIGSASNFNGCGIAVYGGMQKGLPLANPAQSGLLFQGTVLQAFGNWVGIDQWIDFFVVAGATLDERGFGVAAPKNLTFDWKKGTPLADAIRTTLSTAYPDFSIDVKIDENLKLNYDAPGYYANLDQFATMVKQVSRQIITKDDYLGVEILLTKKAFSVYDGTTKVGPTSIAFQDLIGQPTWIEAPTISIKTVMRADLAVGDYIKMPNAVYTTTSAAQSFALKNKSAFQGTFQISSVRHLGDFRNDDAAAWVTVIEANPTNVQSAAA